MRESLLILAMLFCHIVDDYYLQGWLASAKQKKWWKENVPNPMYRNDYIIALMEHAFSWTFMIHIPVALFVISGNVEFNVYSFWALFAINWIVHAITDNMKANLYKIDLVQDQLIHIFQIICTWGFYIIIGNR